jgi:cytochrome b6-f complex iron-sulfur subunit
MDGTLKRIFQTAYNRRSLLFASFFAMLYISARFIGFSVPKKPIRIEVNNAPPASGYLLLPDFIVFDIKGKSWALSRRCTHLGCKLNFHETSHTLECPCHQSQFSVDGHVLQGPAKKALAIFPVEKRKSAPYYIITSQA